MARNSNFAYAPYGSIPSGIEVITLSDDTEHSGVQGFISDTSGVLAVKMADDSTGSYPVSANVMYPGAIKQFLSTGSTDLDSATIHAFY